MIFFAFHKILRTRLGPQAFIWFLQVYIPMHVIFYRSQHMHVFLPLNNSSNNKWFDLKIPSWNLWTIIASLTCFLNFFKFQPWGECLAYILTNLPSLLIIFFYFFHNALNVDWTTKSFNCKYFLMHVFTSHWPYGYPPLMLHPWQWVHKNPWCSLWHLYCHYQLPCGTKTITCASFNHV